ncbi:MAG: type IV pilus modification protein PilV [Gammaproteobacteria bacterium]|nr:type IV pilus modification protein PilV [Gammaproteobacteria bacterium]
MLNAARRRCCAGFTLLEVLVALVVFSVGLLGIVSLQIVSKKAIYDSLQRMTAANLANEVIERMRANPGALDMYLGIYMEDLPTPATDCGVSTCNPAELAAYDLWSFGAVISGALETSVHGNAGGISDPTFCVSGPLDGSSGNYEVAIAWRGRSVFPSRPAHLCGVGQYGSGEGSRRLLTFSTFLDAGES